MANAVLFIGWDRPLPGVDSKKAFGQLVTEGIPSLRKHEGKAFERLETIGLTPHGGDVNSVVLLHGERSKLDELRRTDEFEALAMKLNDTFSGVAIVPGVNEEGIKEVMDRWQKR
jgi:hypothetical protein